MAMWTPDPSFYPSPRMAARAPAEGLAYVAAFDPERQRPDEMAVVDVDPASSSYSQIVGRVPMPNSGDELHHFGWNACSSCLCPNAPHPHVERRYLVVPGLRSSRIHILDTKPDPRNPKIVKVVEPEAVAERSGYTRPHTVHCGPDGIYVAALGNEEGKGPGGVLVMDHESFDVLGRWEVDRGPQHFAYDMWWHLGHDTVVTSEWGTPDMFEEGLIPELLLGSQYGRKLHFWDLHKRKHLQEIDFGKQHQLIFELRPAHDPTKPYGFVNCVVSLENLSSSIWLWHRDPADDLRVARRGGIEIDNGEFVGAPALRIEARDIRQPLGRGARRHPRRGIKTRIGCPCRHAASPIQAGTDRSAAAAPSRNPAQSRMKPPNSFLWFIT